MSNGMGTTGDSPFSLPPAFAGVLILLATAAVGDEPDYVGDVTGVRTIRRVEQHPQAGVFSCSLVCVYWPWPLA